MALPGLGWQEKVGPLWASGSGQGGDQTQGSREGTWGMGTCAQHRPPRSRGCSGRRLPQLPVPLPSCRAAPWRCRCRGSALPRTEQGASPAAPSQCSCRHSRCQPGAYCPGRTRAVWSHAQSTGSKGRIRPQRGKRFLAEAEAPVPMARTPRSLLEFSLAGGMRGWTASSPPRCQTQPGGTSPEHLPPRSAWHRQPAAAQHQWWKNKNRKALKTLSQPGCCSLLFHHAILRCALTGGWPPAPLCNHPCPPQTPNLLVPVLSSEKPRRRADGWCGRSQAGAAGAPLPPQRVPGWQLRNCLSTNTRNCSEGFVQNSVEGKQTCSWTLQGNMLFRGTCPLGLPLFNPWGHDLGQDACGLERAGEGDFSSLTFWSYSFFKKVISVPAPPPHCCRPRKLPATLLLLYSAGTASINPQTILAKGF